MDHVRELQALELAARQADEHDNPKAAERVRQQIPAAVKACRAELARLEGNPPNYGSAAYAQDVDQADRLREALAAYEEPEQAEPEQEATGMFDPSEHDIPSTLAHLEGAGEAEAQRVLDAEAAGKGRKTLTEQRDQILARERAVRPKETTQDTTPKERT